MSPQKSEQIIIGRAKNALLSYFEQRLSVPKIYLDADWEGEKVDVLAIDRDGVGDVSVALLVERGGASSTSIDPANLVLELMEKLRSLPAHFKYLVAISNDANAWEKSERGGSSADVLSKLPLLYAADGVGRIGHILVDFSGERPNITVPISAERFRSNQRIYDLADSFAISHTADFEVRQ